MFRSRFGVSPCVRFICDSNANMRGPSPCVCNRRIFFMNASNGPKAAVLLPARPAIPFDGPQPLWIGSFSWAVSWKAVDTFSLKF